MSMATFKGALKSKTVWWNILLVLLASLEMFAGHFTTLFGKDVAAMILLVGAVFNLVLRTITTKALAEK